MPPTIATVTATSSSSSTDALSAGSIAGIVVGSFLGVLLAGLVFYLLRRYKRHKFTRVANPTHESSPTTNDLPTRSARHSRHSKKPSVSSEPLISPVSWPPIPSTSRIHSPVTPPRSDSLSPAIRDTQYSPAKFTSASVSHSPAPYTLNIPPGRKSEQGSSSPKSQQSFFVHRMLQSRAQASDSISLVHLPSLGFVQGSSSTRGSSIMDTDVEQLLADAERTALRDAETAQRVEEKRMPAGEEEDRVEVESSESVYSQLSAVDHPSSCGPLSRPNSSLTARRRKSSTSSRRQPRTTELIPVAEMPDTPRMLEGRSDSRPASFAANSSLDGQISHGTASRSMFSVVDQPGTLPLLTSVNFGKDSTTSATTAGSMSSTAGWGSSSSGRASRYPSLAPSSIGQSSQNGPRSDGDTDWRHPPPGLSGLKTLQIGPLQNPHSPVEERPVTSLASCPVNPAPAKRAHLREGTASSIPEIERRTVTQGGIARIDVTL